MDKATKDYIKENYVRVIVTKIGDVIVRAWRPKIMDKLPAFYMYQIISDYSRNLVYDKILGRHEHWNVGNPDCGQWDARIAVHYIPGRNIVDIYFCSILCIPYSQDARLEYTRQGVNLKDFMPAYRIKRPWDSRVYDAVNNNTPIEKTNVQEAKDIYLVRTRHDFAEEETD